MSRRGWCYSAVCGRKRQRGERLFIVRRFGEDVGTSFGADIAVVRPLDAAQGNGRLVQIKVTLERPLSRLRILEPQAIGRAADHRKGAPFAADEEVRRGHPF